MRYRENMSQEETAVLMAEVHAIESAYAAAEKLDNTIPGCMQEHAECNECMTCVGVADPVADGWVGRDGLP